MEPILIFALLIPGAAILVSYFLLHRTEVNWLGWGLQIALTSVLITTLFFGFKSSAGMDQEVWNGQVISKEIDRFACPMNTMNPCQNGYDCNCVTVCTPTTDSKGNVTGQSCSTTCDTCYVYPWEQDFHVDTNLPAQFTIKRVDRQGARTPPRWQQTRVGDPVSNTHSYQNWLKAASGSLFKDAESTAERYEAILPKYPIRIYDYWRVDRIVTPNVQLANERVWNDQLSRTLGRIGPKKQINAIFVFVKADRDYARALRYHWQGFKKNDAVVFIGLDARNNVRWAEVLSWSAKPRFDYEARHLIENYAGQPVSALDPMRILPAFEAIANQHYVRRPMEDFEYLREDIPVPLWLTILLLILATGAGIGSAVFQFPVDLERITSRDRRYR